MELPQAAPRESCRLVIMKLNNDFTEYPSMQFSNAEEYKTPKEYNEDILECDYDSQETLISRIIENTEIVEPRFSVVCFVVVVVFFCVFFLWFFFFEMRKLK